MTENYNFFGGKIGMTIYHEEEEKEPIKGLTVEELIKTLEQLAPYEKDLEKVVFIKSGNDWKTIDTIKLDPDDGQVLITLK